MTKRKLLIELPGQKNRQIYKIKPTNTNLLIKFSYPFNVLSESQSAGNQLIKLTELHGGAVLGDITQTNSNDRIEKRIQNAHCNISNDDSAIISNLSDFFNNLENCTIPAKTSSGMSIVYILTKHVVKVYDAKNSPAYMNTCALYNYMSKSNAVKDEFQYLPTIVVPNDTTNKVPEQYQNRILIFEKLEPINEGNIFKLTCWEEVEKMLRDIAKVLDFLHDNNFHHGDCSVYNIGFRYNSNGRKQYLLFDFDDSKQTNDCKDPDSCPACNDIMMLLENLVFVLKKSHMQTNAGDEKHNLTIMLNNAELLKKSCLETKQIKEEKK